MTIHTPGAALEFAHPRVRGILQGKDLLRIPVQFGIVARATDDGTIRAPNGKTAHVKITASSETLSADNGIVPIAAWQEDINRYLANPVVLFGHSHRDPVIGRSVDLRFRRSGLRRMVQWWLFNELSELSKQTRALYAAGEMRAASVGFLVHQWHRITEDETKRLIKKFPHINDWTWIADRAELAETSAVAVGSDPNALTDTASLEREHPLVQVAVKGIRSAPAVARHTLERAYEAAVRQCATGDGAACELAAAFEAAGGWTEMSIDAAAVTAEAAEAVRLTAGEPDEEDRPTGGHGPQRETSIRAPWDSALERAAMTADQVTLTAGHAWRDTNQADATDKSGYRFPHHRAADGSVSVLGVAEGLVAACLWQGPERDVASAWEHLAAHYGADFQTDAPTRDHLTAALAELTRLDFDADADAVTCWALGRFELLAELGAGSAVAGYRAVTSAIAGFEAEPEEWEFDGTPEQLTEAITAGVAAVTAAGGVVGTVEE